MSYSKFCFHFFCNIFFPKVVTDFSRTGVSFKYVFHDLKYVHVDILLFYLCSIYIFEIGSMHLWIS